LSQLLQLIWSSISKVDVSDKNVSKCSRIQGSPSPNLAA
jgi:hypothetical protein